MIFIKNFLLSLVLLLSVTSALFSPKIKSTEFEGAPHVLYFEDTTKIVYLDKGNGNVYFSKDGGDSFNQLDFEGHKIKDLIMHPYKPGHAFALSMTEVHFRTVSSGMMWKKFTTPEPPSYVSKEFMTPDHPPLVFHGKRSDYILFAGRCGVVHSEGETCERQFYYTVDDFNEIKPLARAHSCIFSDATPEIIAPDGEKLVTCIIEDGQSGTVLARSRDWFASQTIAIYNAGMITDINSLGAGSHYLLAVGAHLSKKETNDVYISYNGYDWDRVHLPEGSHLSSDFSIVEGTESEFFVDIKYPNSNFGRLFGSSANGSYFYKVLDFTHRDDAGNIDYEHIESLDGVVLANIVENARYFLDGGSPVAPAVTSRISFDQGNTWSRLTDDEGNGISLFSLVQRAITYPDAPGKYFSSPVPGVLMAVGNKGALQNYFTGDTYISVDAGLTWKYTLNGPHIFEFGDQGSIIVAVEDFADTNVVKYSTNQGLSWNQIQLDETFRVKLLTTTPDSTIFKFLISGELANGKYKTWSLNFEGLYNRKCASGDFEDWYLKGVGSNEPLCVDGHKQKFIRRKREADCKVDNVYNEPIPVEDSCACTEADFVCAFNFEKDESGKCIAASESVTTKGAQAKQCVANAEYYYEPSPYVLRFGNKCSTDNGVNLAVNVQAKCPNFVQETASNNHNIINYDEDDKPDETEKNSNPSESEGEKKSAHEELNDGRVKISSYGFDGQIIKYVYLERVPGSNLKDETLVILTSHNKAYVTHDQGSTWEQIAPEEEFLDIIVNPHNTNHVYLLSPNQKIVYSIDRADNWNYFRTPAPHIPGKVPLQFHAKHSNWFIYTGQLGCENLSLQGGCRTVTYYTKSYGKRFAKLQEHVKSCEYIGHLLEPTDEQLIICLREENENTIHTSELLVTKDFFQVTYEPLRNVIGFTQADDYLVAATEELDGTIKAHVSVDGMVWTDALFPHNFRVNKQQAYTVLSAASKAIFLHVTTNDKRGAEFGTILKSNSNGTFYSVSANYVNRDAVGYVDFEQMTALEGVAFINTVSNFDDARRGSRKILKSKISHNDGAQWDYLKPPGVDSEGKKYQCTGDHIEECSLHLHGYTERSDYRDTLSSGSAVGMMIGVGNVGKNLDSYLNGNTYLTRDGGLSWKEVKKGVYQWEYGDQGSIVVLVNGQDSTDTISYSLDEGNTWNDFKFTDHLVNVNDIATVPSDDSRKFLLFTRLTSNKGDRSTVYQIDFSQLLKRKCSLDLGHPDDDDFELWTPRHPHQTDNCLFGHESQLYRKIPGRDCYVGEKITEPWAVVRNCGCSRQDYECDWNYELDSNGECKLVPGYNPPDHSAVCREMGMDEYWLPTGYRRIPLTTCQRGFEFDKVEAIPCPGKEEEFKIKHKGLTGLRLFLVISIPILAAICLVVIIYHHYVGKYGQIRLGEEEIEFDNSSPLNKFTSIIGFSVVTAVSYTSGGLLRILHGGAFIVDWIKYRLFQRSVSLDRGIIHDPEEASALSGDHDATIDIEDDVLDDGDLTEAEDERV